MLCQNCHEREATCHITEIEGNAMRSRHLCKDCHEAISPEAREFAAEQRDTRCEYCGGKPCAGGTDFLAMITGVQKLKFMCLPCSMEHNRYIQQQLQQDASNLSQEEQLAMLQEVNREADEHMKRWVSKSGSQ